MVYCGYGLCSPDEYCCGINRCCGNSFSRVYIGAGICLFILLALIWYFCRIRKKHVNIRRNVLVRNQNDADAEPLMHPEDMKILHIPE